MSVPRVSISNITEDKEETLLEIDGDKLHDIADSPLLVGIMSSGAEDKMFNKIATSPGIKPERCESPDQKEEEVKS